MDNQQIQGMIPTKLDHITEAYKLLKGKMTKEIRDNFNQVAHIEGDKNSIDAKTTELYLLQNLTFDYMNFQIQQNQIRYDKVFQWVEDTIKKVEKGTGEEFEGYFLHQLYLEATKWYAQLQGMADLQNQSKIEQIKMNENAIKEGEKSLKNLRAEKFNSTEKAQNIIQLEQRITRAKFDLQMLKDQEEN